jgi:adenylosuccinate lyase
MNAKSSLHALGPLDGRYRNKVEDAAAYFSEFAYIRHRVEVEVEYLIHLLKIEPPLPQFAKVPRTIEVFEGLKHIYRDFSEDDALWIKQTETSGGAKGGPELATNHDVKSVEYFVKSKMKAVSELLGYDDLDKVKEFVHFGLTSQDINNTSYPLMLSRFFQRCYMPQLFAVVAQVDTLARKWAHVPLLARTHGQPASPTMMGKEMMVFVERLKSQIRLMVQVPHNSKVSQY